MAELNKQLIAEAALQVADESGTSGFTMRAVADKLGVTPMALYHHVDDKAALVGLVVDAVIAGRILPPPTGSWEEDLWEMARWMREVTLAHPAVSRLRKDFGVWTSSIFPMTERWISIWQQSGLKLESAMTAASATSSVIIGFVDQELVLRELEVPDAALLASFPNARHAFKAKSDGAGEFELVVRSVIEGVHGRLAEEDRSRVHSASVRRRSAEMRTIRSAKSRGERGRGAGTRG